MDPLRVPSEKKRTKTPKPRNSEARKEQNRIASRAYSTSFPHSLVFRSKILTHTFSTPQEKNENRNSPS